MKMKMKTKPDFMDQDRDGNRTEPMKQAVKSYRRFVKGKKRVHAGLFLSGGSLVPMKEWFLKMPLALTAGFLKKGSQ